MHGKTTAEWLRLFNAAKIPAGPLRFPEEVFDDQQVAANGYLVSLEHPVAGAYKTVAPAVKMAKSPLAVQGTAPLFGEHTREVLAEARYSREEIEGLIERGVVAARG
jgi:crotonobetainyl-CoA:carnitine CoA-transferase CaiB-like acyl-CoA transferase